MEHVEHRWQHNLQLSEKHIQKCHIFKMDHRRHICILFKFSPALDKYFEEDKIKENLHGRDSRFIYVYNNELSENEIRL